MSAWEMPGEAHRGGKRFLPWLTGNATVPARRGAGTARPSNVVALSDRSASRDVAPRKSIWKAARQKGPFADLHLLVDGTRIDPVVQGLVVRFLVPAGACSLCLISETARPCDVFGSGDARKLGVCLAGLVIYDGFGGEDRIELDDHRLQSGVHDMEESCRRWTSGRTPVPLDIVARHPNGFFLRVELAGPTVWQQRH